MNIQLNWHYGIMESLFGVPLLVLPPVDSSPSKWVSIFWFISTSANILNMEVGLDDIPWCYTWYFTSDSYQYEMYYKASSVMLNLVSNSSSK